MSIKEKEKLKEPIIITTEVDSKAEVDQGLETDLEDCLTKVDLSMDTFREGNLRGGNFRGRNRRNSGTMTGFKGIEVGQGIDSFSGNFRIDDRSSMRSCQDQGQVQVPVKTG